LSDWKNFYFKIETAKKYFLVYDDSTHTEFLTPLCESVKKHSTFDVIVFDKKEIDAEFCDANQDILSCNRGGGYWLWKPYIIQKVLGRLREGDYLFYMDSKYLVKRPFTELYSNITQNKMDFIVWKNKPRDREYLMRSFCKMDVIKKYDIYDAVFNRNKPDCWAGALFFKNTAGSRATIDEWLKLCCCYEDITDSPSVSTNCSVFDDHRHDQSLLSVVLTKRNYTLNSLDDTHILNLRPKL
jgi:hypothetical protein